MNVAIFVSMLRFLKALGSSLVSDTNVHVLHDEISGAIVDETTGHVRIGEKRVQLLD